MPVGLFHPKKHNNCQELHNTVHLPLTRLLTIYYSEIKINQYTTKAGRCLKVYDDDVVTLDVLIKHFGFDEQKSMCFNRIVQCS